MKPSGIEWIGDIPDDWEVIRFKNILQVRDDLSTNGDELLLSVSQYTGVTPRSEKIEDGDFISRADSLVGYRICNRNDLVMNIMLAWNGSLAFSNYDGIVSPAYAVFFIYNNNFYYKFLHYLLRTSAYTSYFRANSTGIIDSRLRLYPDVFGRLYCIYPPLATQQKIADYLDEKCDEIDKTIEKQKESIEKLKTYKQSLISETVTKGLNKSTPLKPTGIDFLGDIPSHWEVKRVKYVANSFEKGNGITKDDVIFDGDIQCVRYGEIYSKYDRQCIESVSDTNIDKIKSPVHISKGDILFAGTGELIEEIGKNIVYMGDKPCLAGGDIIILKHNQNPIFLNYALNSTSSQSQKSYGKLKLKVVHISASAIGNIRIALPPITEQNNIAEFLDRKCEEIDSTINKKQNLIEKLDAYKKSLIFECVTGKRTIF